MIKYQGCSNCKFMNTEPDQQPCVNCCNNYLSQFAVSTNHDRLMNMSVHEMAHELSTLFYKVHGYTNTEHYIKKWLLKEIGDDDA